MTPFMLTVVMLVLLSQAVPGSTERCWNLHGTCREECRREENGFIFCPSGKLCCVKPRFQQKLRG
ncbi:unnamed protein product [Pipistrellus nathusii]|uniref:Beta-defensin n=1 Tax=Pipistrellus nathusii TaxID=59473 RepID=A0ABP0AAM6_PIPNA